jgi:cell shape-determining protein MreD
MWHTQVKLALEQYTGISQDALHVHAAIILYLVAMLVLRRSWRSPLPWLVVFALETVNELLDLREQYAVGATSTWREAFAGGFAEGLKDVLNTMIWPTVLLLVGRYASQIGRGTAQEASSA